MIDGAVSVSTPPGIPSINIHDPWDGEADENSDTDMVDWDIPSWVPGGITLTVSGYHNDEGASCSGSIKVKLDGNITDSPPGHHLAGDDRANRARAAGRGVPAALGTEEGTTMGARRGQPVLGGFSGFLFGIFLSFDLLFLSVIELDSILVYVLPVGFLVVGVLFGLFTPFGRR